MTDHELAGLFKHYPTMFTLDPRHVAQRVFFLLKDNHNHNDEYKDKDKDYVGSNNSAGIKAEHAVIDDDSGYTDDGVVVDDDDDEDDDDDDRPAPIAPPPFLRNMGYSVAQLKRLLELNPRAIFYSERHFEALRQFFAAQLHMGPTDFCQVTSPYPNPYP